MSTQTNENFTLLFGGKKHSIVLPSTVAHLQQQIHHLTDVEPNQQQLLLRGKKLTPTDPDQSPASLGIVAGSTAMLMCKFTPTSKPSLSFPSDHLRSLRAIETRIADTRRAIDDAFNAVSRHTNGFLDNQKTTAALDKDDRIAQQLDEKLTRMLEEMDSMSIPSQVSDHAVAEWRAERKALVNRIQQLLRRIDELRDSIKDWLGDEYGELAARRGSSVS